MEWLRRRHALRRTQTGQEIHGPQERRGPDLEGHPTPGRRPAPQAANVATKTKKSRKATKVADGAPTAREGSKKATVLELVRRPGGATLKEIMAATSWQAHSVRGFISGSLTKKMGLKIESIKREDGERAYVAH